MALFGKEYSGGLKLCQVSEFQFFLMPSAYKRLQEKLQCSDDFLERMKKREPQNVTCKLEAYEDDSGWSYRRAKVWTREAQKSDFYEVEDMEYNLEQPFCFWSLRLGDLLTDEEKKDDKHPANILARISLDAVFDVPMDSFLIYLCGGKFEKDSDAMIDVRMLQDKILPEAILSKVTPYDFKTLEAFDVGKAFAMPGDADFYYPTDYHRRYSNWKCGRPGSSDSSACGIGWYLSLYDFSKKLFPKENKA